MQFTNLVFIMTLAVVAVSATPMQGATPRLAEVVTRNAKQKTDDSCDPWLCDIDCYCFNGCVDCSTSTPIQLTC
jgi:hypothetical protein